MRAKIGRFIEVAALPSNFEGPGRYTSRSSGKPFRSYHPIYDVAAAVGSLVKDQTNAPPESPNDVAALACRPRALS
jgi:hypothetical protein